MTPACAAVREIAPELALGILDGAERGEALAHVAGCAECRAFVDDLSRASDALYLTAPEAEPSPGFEARVVATWQPGRKRWRAAVLAAAAALLLVGALLGVTVRHPDRSRQYAGPMLDRSRASVGHAVVYEGRPGFVFVTIDRWGESGSYQVEAVLGSGAHVLVAPIRLDHGRGAAGGLLTAKASDVRAIWVTDAEHDAWCAFRL